MRSFRDSWRGKPAHCHLWGEGSGPEGEAVRLVASRARDCVMVWYVRSYEPGRGHAEMALRELALQTGKPLKLVEIVTAEGLGMARRMIEKGVAVAYVVDRADLEEVNSSFTPSTA